MQAQHEEQQSSSAQKLQLVLHERTDLQKLVASLQLQLQVATEKAEQSTSIAAPTSREQPLQPPQRMASQAGAPQQDAVHSDAARAASSGLAGLGLEEQEAPNARSGSRFSLSSVQSQGSTALSRRLSGVGSGALINGSSQPHLVGSGLASQLSSASGSPMASQARLQQLSGSLSGVLNAEGQLQRTVQQLQQELSAVTKARDAAAEQLYQMVRQADAAAAALQETQQLKQKQAELQHKVRAPFATGFWSANAGKAC